MARKTDIEQHDRRKAEVAAAVWRLAGRSGLEAVSMSEVAREAGMSVGRVQYYFGSKDEMLLYGLELAQRRMEDRIQERLRRMDTDVGDEEILRAVLGEVIAGDEDSRRAIRVSVAYLPRAGEDARISEVLFDGDEELHTLAREVVREAKEAGRIAEEADPDVEARIIWTLADGLGTEVAFGRTTDSDALATMDYFLDRTLGR